jgi:hypothetical protein
MQKLVTFLFTTLANLNVFPVRDFGSNIDRITAKRLGQWATLLYMVLLVIGMVILALYIIFQPENFTKTFDKPSLQLYEQLFQRYENKLKCSCSSIASKYDQFVKIEPMFHQVRKYTIVNPSISNHFLEKGFLSTFFFC